MNTITTCSRRLLLAMSLLAISQMAFAQFVWLDDKGVRQYSDRPPPPSVPRKHILKAPAETAPLAVTEPAATTPTGNPTAVPTTTNAKAETGAPAKNAAPMTTAERNADYVKRKMDEAEKEKKSAEAAKLAADKKANCERAQTYSRGLEDGGRITTTDKNGERAYLSDAQRAQEIRNTRSVLASCK